MSKVSINRLSDFAREIDASPLPTDLFTVTLTREHIKYLRWLMDVQVKTERCQLDYYIKRDYARHPERKTIDRFRERLRCAEDLDTALKTAKLI